MNVSKYDVVVIGSGPAGQKAALQAAEAGKKTVIIERDRVVGGACVHRGTIPSKTLRENALRVREMRKNASFANFKFAEESELAILLHRLEKVLQAHDEYMQRQIERQDIDFIHGRAKFLDSQRLEIRKIRKPKQILEAGRIVIATGSIPRNPPNMAIDHEHVFDSDSVLSMLYLPKSLTVLGGGVIASEYASIFQALGVQVTMIDRYPLPLGFLDDDLTTAFVEVFEQMGGRWAGGSVVADVHWDGISKVICTLDTGEQFESDKALVAAGRIANIADLCIENAGLELNDKQLISVDQDLRTAVPGIYAAGDVIGPPSLASSSMEQGRRAACNAFQLETGQMGSLIPTGIYAIPELSAVGENEESAKAKYGDILIGRARFDETARGQISGATDGFLKLIADSEGRRLLGVMIVGEGATELIHIGQMALIQNEDIDVFVENIFNFPTLAEAYREAALSVIAQRNRRMLSPGQPISDCQAQAAQVPSTSH